MHKEPGKWVIGLILLLFGFGIISLGIQAVSITNNIAVGIGIIPGLLIVSDVVWDQYLKDFNWHLFKKDKKEK